MVNLTKQAYLALFRLVTEVLFRIDTSQLHKVPMHGPLILVANHINIWEVPIIYTQLQPRKLHGMVLDKRWSNRFLAPGLNACEAIPVERGGINLHSMHLALNYLRQGEIILILPEGTRNRTGRLQAGHPGVVTLALKSKAPILPIGYYGNEFLKTNLKRLRRTDFHIAVGEPFQLKYDQAASVHQIRQIMVDDIMYQLAALLPPENRGVYAEPPLGAGSHLVFARVSQGD